MGRGVRLAAAIGVVAMVPARAWAADTVDGSSAPPWFCLGAAFHAAPVGTVDELRLRFPLVATDSVAAGSGDAAPAFGGQVSLDLQPVEYFRIGVGVRTTLNVQPRESPNQSAGAATDVAALLRLGGYWPFNARAVLLARVAGGWSARFLPAAQRNLLSNDPELSFPNGFALDLSAGAWLDLRAPFYLTAALSYEMSAQTASLRRGELVSGVELGARYLRVDLGVGLRL